MSISNSAKSKPSIAVPFDEDRTFAALAGVARRRLLVALAKGGPQTGADLLNVGKGRGPCTAQETYLDSTVKNLKLMVDAGIVVQHINPRDGRRPLYALAPEVNVTIGKDVIVFDFGFWVVRLSPDGN